MGLVQRLQQDLRQAWSACNLQSTKARNMWKTELVNIAVNELSLLKMSLYCPNAGHRRVSQWYILVMTAILE